ncbi:cytochrome b [Labrys okinawensis]|nr:cytochrome b [Labrys okinawensis]
MKGTASRSHRWSATGQFLHWSCAALILFMLGLGLAMVEWVEDQGQRFDLYQLHKSLGALVFLLMALRAAWRLLARAPVLPESMPRHERVLSKTVHVALYGLIFAMLVTGYVMISASPLPLPIQLPGGGHVPNLVAPDFELSERMKALHHRIAFVLIGLVLLHVAAAFKHWLWDRDGVLQSMLPGRG